MLGPESIDVRLLLLIAGYPSRRPPSSSPCVVPTYVTKFGPSNGGCSAATDREGTRRPASRAPALPALPRVPAAAVRRRGVHDRRACLLPPRARATARVRALLELRTVVHARQGVYRNYTLLVTLSTRYDTIRTAYVRADAYAATYPPRLTGSASALASESVARDAVSVS